MYLLINFLKAAFILFITIITVLHFFTYIKLYNDDPTVELYFTSQPLIKTIYSYEDIDCDFQYLLAQDENVFRFQFFYVNVIKNIYFLLIINCIFISVHCFIPFLHNYHHPNPNRRKQNQSSANEKP